MFERLLCGAFSNLVQLDALRMRQLEQLSQMPGDRLAFAVGVGRKVYVVGLFRGGPQLFDDVALSFYRDVGWGEVIIQVNSQSALGQIAYVTDRSQHLIARA